MPSNHSFFIKLSLLLVLALLSGCNDSNSKEATPDRGPVATPVADPVIIPGFNRSGQNNESPAAKAVAAAASLNASGSFSHPVNNETFAGNLLLSVDVEDPDGLASVAISFNQQQELLYLCESEAECSGAPFHKTLSNINPTDFGLFSGPLTLGLWSKDINGNQLQLDSVTVNWQRRQIAAVTAERPSPGGNISADWQLDNDLFRYNLYLAAEPGVNRDNFTALSEGQALLSVTGPPQTFSNLDSNTSYYLLVTGIDSSGESAFSSEIRLDPASGQENTPPQPQDDHFEQEEDNEIRGNLLVNDTDNEQNPLTLSLLPVRPPVYGDLELAANGNFTYQPPENFTGSDSFAYQVQDGQGGFAQGEVSLTLLPVNDAPLALADSFNIAKNQILFAPAPGLLINDSDIDSETLTLNPDPVTSPDFGQLILNSDGSFSYTPDDDFTGEDNFRYQVTDPEGAASTALVTITVAGSNTAPLAINDSYGTAVNTTLVVDGNALPGVLANDSDADDDPLRLQPSLIDNVDNGTLTIAADGFFTYIPNGNFSGTDSFVYAIEDGRGGTAQAGVTITVGAANTPPQAVSDIYSTDKNTPLTAGGNELPGVLANDTDVDNDPLVLQLPLIDDVDNGQLSIDDNGFFTYIPNVDFSGTDTFVYTVSDGRGGTAQASVSILVDVTNTAPLANSDSYETPEKTTLIVDGNALPGVLENDTDAENDSLRVSGLIEDVDNGILTLAEEGFFTYTPNEGFFGSDSFIYAVEDGRGGTAQASVLIAVSEVNFPPLAVDDNFILDEDEVIILDLLANDSDEDGDALTITDILGDGSDPISDPSGIMAWSTSHGKVFLEGDVLSYTPNPDYNGIDSFSYFIDDGHDQIASAIVTLTINPVNDAPIAEPDEFGVDIGVNINLDVLANDSDSEGDSLTITQVVAGSGNVTILADNTLDYVLPASETGDTFSYQIEDGNGGIGSAQVTITLNNQPPFTQDDSYRLAQDTALIVDNSTEGLLANDSDLDGDTLTVITTPLVDVGNGILALAGDGTFTYTPNSGFVGIDSFEYKLSDGTYEVSALVELEVRAKPLAKPDHYHLQPNTSINITNITDIPLANDLDADGKNDTLTYQDKLADVENGVLSINSDSSFSYTPNTNFTGTDSFLYYITDDLGGRSRALATLSVEEVSWGGDDGLPNLPPLNFNHLSFDGMHYYLLADHNTFTSSDAVNWEHAYHEQSTSLTGATAGKTLLSPALTTRIAVGKAGSVFINQESDDSAGTEDDGVWVERQISVDVAMQDIIFTGAEFVAAGLQKVMFSLDGIDWAASVPNSPVVFHALNFDLGILVIVGENGAIETADNSTNWTVRTSTTSEHLYDIASNDADLLVAVGANGTVLTSNDGISWVPVTSTTSVNLYGVEYANGVYMAVGDNGTVIASNDGMSWSLQASLGSAALNDIIWDGGKFIIAGDNTQLLASSDAVNFTQVDPGDHSNFNGIALSPGSTAPNNFDTLVRAGENSNFLVSSDGFNWTPSTTTISGIINQVEYLNGEFIAVGDNALVMASSDGNTWTSLSVPTGENLQDIFWHDSLSLYVIVGENGLLMTSNDGISWVVETLTDATVPAEHLYAVGHDGSAFIAVGQNGKILHRDDTATPGGTTWSDSYSNTGFGQLNDLDSDGSKAIIVGDNGVIVSGSVAGNSFSQLSTGFTDNLNTIAHQNGNYLALGDLGATYTSKDGVTWLSAFAGTGENLNDVIIQNHEVFAVGEKGTFIRGHDHF